MITPLKWQAEALKKYIVKTDKYFLLEATPGAGKTIFSGLVARHLFQNGLIDFVLIVTPNTTIKGDESGGFLHDWNSDGIGIQITTNLKDAEHPPKQFRGGAITYYQLPHIMSSIQTWIRKHNLRLFVVFDEIHHASEDNDWGLQTELLGDLAAHVLGMTGTCFRGDERKISFVKYDGKDKAIADHRYLYRQAVTDGVCRQVDFITDDSITEFMLNNENHSVRVSEAKTYDEIQGATRTVFRTDHDFLKRVLNKAEDYLDQYRSWDSDAGGLILCRSGMDDNDNRHLHHIAKLVHQTLGQYPEVVSYDDTESSAKIAKFRESNSKWICAIRKISEGVDIKRLRVEVMATRPTTELLFRQMVGRVVRVDDKKKPGTATVFIARFPQLLEWAEAIAEEAKAGLADREKLPKKKNGDGEKEQRPFFSIGASHEDAGAVSDYGEQYTADEVNAAERLRGNDPQLIDVAITTLAYIQRKLGVKPDPAATPEPPLQIRKKELRSNIARKQRRLAIIRNPKEPDYKRVWKEIQSTFGPKHADDLTDNYSLDIMRQVDAWLLATIAKESSHGK